MKCFLLTVFVVLAVTLSAQQSSRDNPVYVRAISVDAPDPSLPPVSFSAIQKAWKEDGVGLAVELTTTPEMLDQLASRAAKVIQRIYESAGHAVSVERQISSLQHPRYVKIRFTVTPAKPK